MWLTHWTQFQTSSRFPLNLQIFLHGSCTQFLSNSSVITLAHELVALCGFSLFWSFKSWKSSYTWCLIVFTCRTDRWDLCPYASFQKARQPEKLFQCSCSPLEVLKPVCTDGAIQHGGYKRTQTALKTTDTCNVIYRHVWKSVFGVNSRFFFNNSLGWSHYRWKKSLPLPAPCK